MALQFGAALAAELRAGLVLVTTLGAHGLAAYGMATLAAELRALLYQRPAVGTLEQAEWFSAVVAELSLSGGFAAMGANSSALLELAVPDGGRLRHLVYVTAHGLAARLGHIRALTRSAVRAEAFLLVPAVGAHPAVARGTFLELRTNLLLSLVERLLLLLAPLGTAVLHTVAQHVGSVLDGVAQSAQLAAEQVVQQAGATADALGTFAVVVGRRLFERTLEAVSAAVAVKLILEAGIG